MPVLICGDKLRLTGKDAQNYLEETGKSKLPKTKAEYNNAIIDTIDYWDSISCPEARLLAALLENKLKE